MDIGAEISKKIQMAITAKLKELDAYVDDELPDYIMIMVANKKTEEQMTEALSLFLSTNTNKFTSWLHNLLATLRKAKSDKASEGTKHHKDTLEKESTKEKEQKSIAQTEPLQAIANYKHASSDVKFQQKITVEAMSDDTITINPETEDVLDVELLLHQTTQSGMHNEKETNAPRTALDHPGQSRKDNKLTNNQEKERQKSTESKKKSHDRKESRSKTDHRSEKDSHSRKRRSDDGRIRHSKLSESRSRSDAKSKLRRDSSGKIATVGRETSSRKRSHKIDRVFGLESDSKRYAKHDQSSHDRLAASKSNQVREWDEGKGENNDELTYLDWDKEDKSHHRSNNDKDFGEMSSDEEKKVSSAVRPVMKDPEFVSESSDDSDDDPKTSKVTSLVAYPKRKSRVPPSKQANRALLIKAVSEAEKSVRRQQMTKVKEEAAATKGKTKVTESPDRNSTATKKSNACKTAKAQKRKSTGDIMPQLENNKQERRISQGASARKKEVIVIRKNLITGDRVSTTSTTNQSKTENQQSSKTKSSQKSEKPTKVILLEDDDDGGPPVTVIHVRRKLHRKTDETEDTKPKVQIYKWDERNFIHRSNSEEQASTSEPVIKFDSRCAEPQQQTTTVKSSRVDKDVKPIVKVLSKPSAKVQGQPGIPRIHSNENPDNPRFIVTLDGVATGVNADERTKVMGEPQSAEKNFVFKPVTAPSPQKTPTTNRTSPRTPSIPTPKQKPVVFQTGDTEDDHEFSEDASDSELLKMRSKLLKMQEDAIKYKQIQAKLAAAQSSALPPSVGTYAGKLDSDKRSIYISNVHFSTTEKQLSEHFSICGRVQRVTILKDHTTGHPKGFAYLEFQDSQSTESALALDNTPLNNRTIRVTRKQSSSSLVTKPLAKPQRYVPTRTPFTRSSATKYFRRGFAQPSPRHHLKNAVRFPSRNKTWVNPALSLTEKSST